MSNPSPQEAASGDFVRTQATNANKLADITFPQLNDLFSQIQGQFASGPTGIPTSVATQFNNARTGINTDFAMTSQGTQAFIKQRAKESGAIYSDEMLTSSLEDAARSADTDRQTALDNLQFQEASAGMSSFNQLMDLLGVGANTALGIGKGASNTASSSLAFLNPQSSGQGAIGGAIAGAGLGTEISPGWGTLIGAVLGGAGGYLSAGG